MTSRWRRQSFLFYQADKIGVKDLPVRDEGKAQRKGRRIGVMRVTPATPRCLCLHLILPSRKADSQWTTSVKLEVNHTPSVRLHDLNVALYYIGFLPRLFLELYHCLFYGSPLTSKPPLLGSPSTPVHGAASYSPRLSLMHNKHYSFRIDSAYKYPVLQRVTASFPDPSPTPPDHGFQRPAGTHAAFRQR